MTRNNLDITQRVRCALRRGRQALRSAVGGLAGRVGVTGRVVRVATLIGLASEYAESVFANQQRDGGWTDVEETVWSVYLLTRCECKVDGQAIDRGIAWLRARQHADGGWGLSERDPSRIVTTGLLAYLLPGASNDAAISWLRAAWWKDLSSDLALTYKGGFFLMALSARGIGYTSMPLVRQTLDYLGKQQNDDGGFGPWKDHPIGSDPWSTGIVLVGLTSWPDEADSRVIERAADWLCRTQLDSGLWPYHFIDEGSAYAYWGLSKALEYFQRRTG